MSPFGRTAVTRDGITYAPGARFRVIAEDVTLDGMVTDGPGGWRGWRQPLKPGDIVTCTGDGPGFGGDPGYGVEFTTDESEAAHASHCEIQPSAGSIWDSRPAPGLLEPLQIVSASPGASA